MDTTHCAQQDCNSKATARGYCNSHYAILQKAGKFTDETCAAPHCDKAAVTRKHGPLCLAHYKKMSRHGDLAPRRRPNGDGTVGKVGYLVVTVSGHPLADQYGRQYQHRVNLYNKIGPGSHPCHWCATPVSWKIDLHTDHLDFDRLNNDPSNLVASCHACNSHRHARNNGEVLVLA